jgi:hypothetical protein
MKLIAITALALMCFLNVATADTEYIDFDQKNFHGMTTKQTGGKIAEILTHWEKSNPDKKIVCHSFYYHMQGQWLYIQGLLITYERR